MIGLSGCVEINGGAAELSWSIRSPEGTASACDLREASGADRPDIADIQLCWEPVIAGQPLGLECVRDRAAVFDCLLSRGATRFEITTGMTALWIEPLCVDGEPAEATAIEVPAPIVREVQDGQIVTLDALLIVAAPQACVRPTPL